MRKGFTLAEVLITLGIIGIVAAMTMPILIEKRREQVTVSKVKKFYSTINQAMQFAINEDGSIKEWNFDNTNKEIAVTQFFEHFKPYLKIAKDCNTQSGCIGDTYKGLSGYKLASYNTDKKYYKLILADGTYMWLRVNIYSDQICNDNEGGSTNACGLVWIDTNGKQPPNVLGKDTFTFIIFENRIMPFNVSCKNAKANGWGCANYILQNGNMNYLKNN